MAEKPSKNNVPKCPNCGSGYVYVKTDGTVVCRRCGEATEMIMRATEEVSQ